MRRWRAWLRRLVNWTCVSGFAFTVASMLACAYWMALGVHLPSGAGVGVSGGAAFVTIPRSPLDLHPSVFVRCVDAPSRDDVAALWVQKAWWPRADEILGMTTPSGWARTPGLAIVRIPLWIPFVAFGIPAVWLWRRDRRQRGPGCCRRCGYDLTGNVSGTCPECGAAWAAPSREAGP